jgi:eukaryotic-like serine/threonine-protein kinase
MTSNEPITGFPASASSGVGKTCSECGFNLSRQTPDDLCPKCLLKAGLRGISAPFANQGAMESKHFGHYQLGKLLGKGGMGEVYEADDLKTGRRIALKILSLSHDSPEARSRFLNEGRIAATINHPNSVYVFDVEDVAGVSVIAMELMPGGTLLDKIKSKGQLSFTEAVDITLQIIDGLAAAHAAGILHRDIKTSNCFIDTDGTVKIGDYGLSISTKGHERKQFNETTFMGTPMFAPPEQLRGDDLTVRSDIYSLGATLYTILSGKPPFVASDTIHLISKVLETTPTSLKEIRTDIPSDLAIIVSRCLEKTPDDRFASCKELRAAILPFSSRGKIAAPPLQKMTAGMIDMAIIATPYLILSKFISNLYVETIELKYQSALLFTTMIIAIAWFTLFEWKRGKTPGKAFLNLEVNLIHDEPNLRKRLMRFFWRSVFFIMGPVVITFMTVSPIKSDYTKTVDVEIEILGKKFEGEDELTTYKWNLGILSITTWFGATFMLFIGTNRRNGWHSLHDKATDTCVMTLIKQEAHRKKISSEEYISSDVYPKAGPFHVLEAIPGSDEWKIGYDPKLLRKVWIHQLSSGAAPVSNLVRSMRRKGRLRWLAGMRSAEENWDAYEFPGGQALISLSEIRVPWHELELWLHDISSELIAASKEGTHPKTASINSIWITSDGHAKLLDFPTPGFKRFQKTPEQSIYINLIKNLLNADPLPLPVISFLKNLPNTIEHEWIYGELSKLRNIPCKVSRSKRIGMAAMSASAPALIGILTFFMYDFTITIAMIASLSSLIFFVAVPAVTTALFFRGGMIMRVFGVCLINRHGNMATGIQAMHRSLIAWLPTLTSPVIIAVFMIWFSAQIAFFLAFLLLASIAVISALIPGKAIHDRLAGTYLVPR